jgi:hypothetical protein
MDWEEEFKALRKELKDQDHAAKGTQWQINLITALEVTETAVEEWILGGGLRPVAAVRQLVDRKAAGSSQFTAGTDTSIRVSFSSMQEVTKFVKSMHQFPDTQHLSFKSFRAVIPTHRLYRSGGGGDGFWEAQVGNSVDPDAALPPAGVEADIFKMVQQVAKTVKRDYKGEHRCIFVYWKRQQETSELKRPSAKIWVNSRELFDALTDRNAPKVQLTVDGDRAYDHKFYWMPPMRRPTDKFERPREGSKELPWHPMVQTRAARGSQSGGDTGGSQSQHRSSPSKQDHLRSRQGSGGSGSMGSGGKGSGRLPPQQLFGPMSMPPSGPLASPPSFQPGAGGPLPPPQVDMHMWGQFQAFLAMQSGTQGQSQPQAAQSWQQGAE